MQVSYDVQDAIDRERRCFEEIQVERRVLLDDINVGGLPAPHNAKIANVGRVNEVEGRVLRAA